MRRYLPTLFLAGLVLVLPLVVDPVRADDPPTGPPPIGTWRILLPAVRDSGGKPVWVVQFENKDKAWVATVLATAESWPKTEIEKVGVGKDSLTFTIKSGSLVLPCEVRLNTASDKLYGSATLRSNPTPVELERTQVTSLDPFDLEKEDLAKKPLGFEAMGLALNLLGQAGEKKAKPSEARGWAEKAVKSAELYGSAWQRNIILIVAQVLSEQKDLEGIAVQYAQRAERMLDAKESPVAQEKVLKVLAGALEKAGKKDEASEALARIAKLDFRIKPRTYPGRKGKSDRAVLIEAFTGAEADRSVAQDLALESLARTFKASEVITLRYHLHLGKPDPLASEENEQRIRFYEDQLQRAPLPVVLLNGKLVAAGGGSRSEAQERYDEYVETIAPELDKPADASLRVQANRKGDKLAITAEVLKSNESGDDIRLRLALVEEEVTFKGGNGLAVHQNVVRLMPGGDEGTAVKEKDKPLQKAITVDLDDLRKKRTAYLDEQAKKRPFPTKERPLDLKKLKVVAFVQNDRTGEVLQATEAEVKAE